MRSRQRFSLQFAVCLISLLILSIITTVRPHPIYGQSGIKVAPGERKLLETYGQRYAEYKRRVHMFLPWLQRSRRG